MASGQRQWIEAENLRRQADYWKAALAGIPELLELPADHPRPPQQDYAGAFAELVLDEPLTARLRELSKRHEVTLFMTLLAGWAALLARLSGQWDVSIGTLAANRTEIEGPGRFLVNTLVLRLDLSGSPAVSELLARVRAQELAARQHQDIPFEQVVELAHPIRSLAHSPLFQVMFAWQNTGDDTLELSGLGVEPLRTALRVVAKFDLTLSLQEEGERIAGGLEYATALFERSTIERYLGHFRTLLEAMAADDSRTVDRLPLLTAPERHQLLYEWNATTVEYPRDKCVHELFEQQAGKTPDATAVVFEHESLTYAELNRRANQLAQTLRSKQIAPGDYVPFWLGRGSDVVIALLGILKVGAAFIPLSDEWPQQRIYKVLADIGGKCVVVNSRTPRSEDIERIDVQDDLERSVAAFRGAEAKGDSPAYAVYTSGTTGEAKAAAVSHAGLLNRFFWMSHLFAPGSPPITVQTTDHIFDSSIWQLLWPLTCGGKAVICTKEQLTMPDRLFNLIVHEDVTIVDLVPSLFGFVTEKWSQSGYGDLSPSLRHFIVGGEQIDSGNAGRFKQRWPAIRLWNLYGPTECTIGSIYHEITLQDKGRIPLGLPIANTRAFLLDRWLQPVPYGVTGEIWLGGACVGLGYLNRPRLTAERFLADPFSSEAGARMYRTGDLGRRLPDGNIEFMGRDDFQVKIRGFRIELGEIEARLVEYPAVREAVVVAREDTPGDKRLVAYFTCTAAGGREEDLPGAQILRVHLSSKVPGYMVPAAYVFLPSLPLTPSGKLDRKALPAPQADAYAMPGYETPAGATETTLAGIWAEVLKLERVGRNDNFFDLGGHSLSAMRIVSRLRQAFSVEVGPNTLFAHPVLADLARNLEDAARTDLPCIPASERGQSLPLSFAQQRLWFLAQIEGASQAYHLSFGWRLIGRLDGAALRQALDRIVTRHEALRTNFVSIDGDPLQRIVPLEESRFHLVEDDLGQHLDPLPELDRLIRDDASMPFDLASSPLIRGRLIRLSHGEHALQITMHHIVSDGWSMGVLAGELSALYRAFAHGEKDPLPKLDIQYADYAVWQRQWIEAENLRKHADYWRSALAGAPELLELPADHPRPPRQDYAGAFTELVLDEQLTARLRELSKRHGVTLFMTLLAGWAALLARLSGQWDVSIGTPAANRGRRELEGLIGFFVNTLVLRLDLSGSPAVSELLARVKAQTLAAQQHQDIPFEQVVELAHPIRSLAHSPLFQVMFAWQNTGDDTLELSGLGVEPLRMAPRVVAKFDLTLSLQEEGERIAGGLEYATALFERSTIERYLGHFRTLLEAMAADDSRTVDRLPLLTAPERHQLLYEWNATTVEYPRDKCVHQLFEQQAGKTPDATAVVFEHESLTYAELNRRANQLAHYLRELGVRPEARVAICIERGLEMVVVLLGVLKAGGAYIPLDPAYPADRLRYILEDSAPTAVLTQERLLERLPEYGGRIVNLDKERVEIGQRGEHNASVTVTSENLAYIIYTSGTTGRPKGVMNMHRGVVNVLLSLRQEIDFSEGDEFAATTTIVFDIAALELYLPLLCGGTVAVEQEPSKRQSVALETKSTVMQATPSGWRFLLNDTWRGRPGMRLLCGGEPLERNLAEELQKQGCAVWNVYGPTETTIWSSILKLEQKSDSLLVPIGRPIWNTHIYVLDRWMEPVPVGVTGELYIGGAGVARGYLNRPQLTAERFLADPFSSEAGERMYRTGDLGRRLPDGNIEFVGRDDFQVKIRGFRIELGEIEARLAEHPDVREAVVLAREDTPGDKRLVAYYTCAKAAGPEQDAPAAEAMRAHLSSKLPEYMVPAAYVMLESLPLTANGKLDRKALPAPEADAYAVRGYQVPMGAAENTLAGIWAEVLKLDRVGRHDNFFDLGGHSLLAMRIISRLRQVLGVEIAVGALFMHPVLADLAATLVSPTDSVEAPPVPVPEIDPAQSHSSEKLEFLI